jgi:cysteine-rich repeat protein
MAAVALVGGVPGRPGFASEATSESASGVPGTTGFASGSAQPSAAAALAPGETGLGPAPFFNLVAFGADFVKAGATTRVAGFVGGPSQTEPFSLVMPAPGGPVTATYISWNYLLSGVAPPTDTIVINGVPVTGSLVGTGAPDLCWGRGGAASYLALDPGAVVVPGPNRIAGATDKLLGTDPDALGEGLTILSVFTAPGAVRNVDLWAGYSSNESEATGTGTADLAFSNLYPGGGAHFLLSALDGQIAPDDFFINGALASGIVAGTAVAGDAWQGLLGPGAVNNLYDQANDIIAVPFLLPGAAGLKATTPTINDCIGHSFAGISFEAPLPECAVFPPAGLDNRLDTLAVVSVEIPAMGLTDSVQLRGPTTIQRGTPFDPGTGRRVIPTEIVQMDLTGSSGVLGPLRLVESPSLASPGEIEAQSPGADFPADSFFDVFFEIETTLRPPFDRLHNEDPIRMRQVIRCIPPLGRIYVPAFRQQIPLFDAAGNLVATLTHAQHGVGDPFCGDGIVDVHEDCDDGNRTDCDRCDSNCTTGCGNAILCEPEQCDDGNNLPGDGCEPTCTETIPPDCLVFPPAGPDDLDTLAVVSIQGLPDESVQFRGPTAIQRGDPVDPGDGRREIQTEILSMDLSGSSSLGTLRLVQSPTLPSIGKIKSQGPDADFPADSFFDVFFEVETRLPPPLDLLHNQDPIQMREVIRCIPPFGRIYVPAFRQQIPLFDVQGNPVTNLTHAQHGITDPFCGDGIVDPHEDCDDGNLIDCDGCDSTCTTGCGNAVLCAPEQCDDGNNLPGDGCEPDCSVASPLDHFKCYSGNFLPRFESRDVVLKDQFESKLTTVIKPKFFCNPVEKTVDILTTPIFDRFAHLKCYGIKDARTDPRQPRFEKRDVLVLNQFGEQVLTVTGPSTLCLPTQKDPLPPPELLDHYKCYKVRGARVNLAARLVDQFHIEEVKVGAPATLCTPVSKEGRPIRNDLTHLTCYKIRAPKFDPLEISVLNQFGPESVRVTSASTLCVPSSKVELE